MWTGELAARGAIPTHFGANVTAILRAAAVIANQSTPARTLPLAWDRDIARGVIALGVFGTLSLVATVFLVIYMILGMVRHCSKVGSLAGYSQSYMLVFNLLVADCIQGAAFTISWRWLHQNAIISPGRVCIVQAALIQMGDMSSGLFSVSIALHTLYFLPVIGRGGTLRGRWLAVGIAVIWLLCLLLTIIGPVTYHDPLFYGRAGAWCWITDRYDTSRLMLHYLWVFIFEFGLILVYGAVFIRLGRMASGADSFFTTNNDLATRIARNMVLYPIVYCVLTLPLAILRMLTMAGYRTPMSYNILAGCLLTSTGWVDAILYTFTRNLVRLQHSRLWRRDTNSSTQTKLVTVSPEPSQPSTPRTPDTALLPYAKDVAIDPSGEHDVEAMESPAASRRVSFVTGLTMEPQLAMVESLDPQGAIPVSPSLPCRTVTITGGSDGRAGLASVAEPSSRLSPISSLEPDRTMTVQIERSVDIHTEQTVNIITEGNLRREREAHGRRYAESR